MVSFDVAWLVLMRLAADLLDWLHDAFLEALAPGAAVLLPALAVHLRYDRVSPVRSAPVRRASVPRRLITGVLARNFQLS